MNCYVCQSEDTREVYTSEKSMTTLCKPHPAPTHVFFCSVCHHVQTREIPDIEAYYAHEYNILINSEEEDQIYAVEAGQKIFRFEHQARTLAQKVDLNLHKQVLDYGCAKSSTWRILKATQPHVDLHLFDVSDNYTPFWSKLTRDATRQATFELPSHWKERFDLVTSFYAFEHISDLQTAMQNIAQVLHDEGLLYILVPDFLVNSADFVVVDHVNHFTADSVAYLFAAAGFELVDIDTESHYGGLIAVGKKRGETLPLPAPKDSELSNAIENIAHYWRNLDTRLLNFEAEHRGRPAVIYGSGFYGSYIASCLRDVSHVMCFLDQNPHRQQEETLMNKPILAPEQIPEAAEVVYVGLNPQIGRKAMAAMSLWETKEVEFCFL